MNALDTIHAEASSADSVASNADQNATGVRHPHKPIWHVVTDQYMASNVHLALLRGGVAGWNRWRMAHPNERPELNGRCFMGAKLEKANLHRANMYRTNFCIADMRGADLSGANLHEAVMCRTDLRGVDVREADLRGAFLYGADLRGADLTGALLFGTTLNEADLRGAVYDESQLKWAHCSRAKKD